MTIDNDTIVFKSTAAYYAKERDGLKPNTLRELSIYECNKVTKHKDEIKRIRIVEAESGDSFEREITDITGFSFEKDCGNWGKVLVIMFIFSWRHDHSENI